MKASELLEYLKTRTGDFGDAPVIVRTPAEPLHTDDDGDIEVVYFDDDAEKYIICLQ